MKSAKLIILLILVLALGLMIVLKSLGSDTKVSDLPNVVKQTIVTKPTEGKSEGGNSAVSEIPSGGSLNASSQKIDEALGDEVLERLLEDQPSNRFRKFVDLKNKALKSAEDIEELTEILNQTETLDAIRGFFLSHSGVYSRKHERERYDGVRFLNTIIAETSKNLQTREQAIELSAEIILLEIANNAESNFTKSVIGDKVMLSAQLIRSEPELWKMVKEKLKGKGKDQFVLYAENLVKDGRLK